MEDQTWNYSGEFLKRAKIIISDKQILLENRELSFMRFPCCMFRANAAADVGYFAEDGTQTIVTDDQTSINGTVILKKIETNE